MNFRIWSTTTTFIYLFRFCKSLNAAFQLGLALLSFLISVIQKWKLLHFLIKSDNLTQLISINKKWHINQKKWNLISVV